MNAADVMVTNVISVGPEASVQDVAHALLNARISALPIIGKRGELLGIVSEGDLMRRAEAGTGRRRPWWLAIFTDRDVFATEFIKEHSRTVTDVMTRDVVTATPDTSLSTIANLLERNAIKRVPIVQGEKVVGIVSRANLLQALAIAGSKNEAAAPANDSAIRDQVLAQLNGEPWSRPMLINVMCTTGLSTFGELSIPRLKRTRRGSPPRSYPACAP
jgi:CBS domain-containing protein